MQIEVRFREPQPGAFYVGERIFLNGYATVEDSEFEAMQAAGLAIERVSAPEPDPEPEPTPEPTPAAAPKPTPARRPATKTPPRPATRKR